MIRIQPLAQEQHRQSRARYRNDVDEDGRAIRADRTNRQIPADRREQGRKDREIQHRCDHLHRQTEAANNGRLDQIDGQGQHRSGDGDEEHQHEAVRRVVTTRQQDRVSRPTDHAEQEDRVANVEIEPEQHTEVGAGDNNQDAEKGTGDAQALPTQQRRAGNRPGEQRRDRRLARVDHDGVRRRRVIDGEHGHRAAEDHERSEKHE